MTALSQFDALLHSQLIPEFCALQSRSLSPEGFSGAATPLSEYDAAQFLRGWHLGLFESDGFGRYRSSGGGSPEQFFWSGSKNVTPRQFSLWLEPIITLGAMARLHLDYEWPLEAIAAQSKDYAFDVVTYRERAEIEAIAGEVKKSAKECDDLVRLLREFGQNPEAVEPEGGKERNAFKKMAALRERKIPLFWLVGPDGYSRVFSVSYEAPGLAKFANENDDALHFAKLPEKGAGNHGSHALRFQRFVDGVSAEGSPTPHSLARLGEWARYLDADIEAGSIDLDDVSRELKRMSDLGQEHFEQWLKDSNP